MDTNLYCSTYDALLKDRLVHLSNYPQFLPFIGNAWEGQQNRILLIAESHYLPSKSNGKSSSQTWYDGNKSLLSERERGWTNTRGIVEWADGYALDKTKFSKGHSIFYNIKNAVFDARNISKKDKYLFHQFGYYNYFQRPAEETGASIQLSGNDYRIAYNTIKAIAEIAQPTDLIFVSKKAYNSFIHWRNKEADGIFTNIRSHSVPHPASAWWNRPHNACDGKSGKQKFIDIIQKIDGLIESVV
ncbi:hypothetical protein [Mucilaginibacter myungsuensis]|uniref:Uracil DNA glycosylase superfamily protein n=1 Tax=Mucilaginibacter myungsuensis TaxID=649104 RepID=A0A929L1Z0_9SPHI|nr:hypothetical protein [Mucilaginibacter myungsuensis]MBE9664663.1 hypothetical protein [Mucilaginibacter myungsuensis]MDN3601131.1 hypothetical protein [Mucilaginibacter myungsuensis]